MGTDWSVKVVPDLLYRIASSLSVGDHHMRLLCRWRGHRWDRSATWFRKYGTPRRTYDECKRCGLGRKREFLTKPAAFWEAGR